MRLHPLLFALSSAVPCFAAGLAKPANDVTADRAALLADVPAITTNGAVGTVLAIGSEAFAVIGGRDAKETLLPAVAAARWEKGRVVALAHNGFLNCDGDDATGRFLANSMGWTTGGAPKPKIAVRKKDALLAHLRSAGFAAEALDGADWTDRLSSFAGLAVDAHALDPKDVAPVAKWLRSGGGLVTAATGWGWQQIHANRKLATDFPGNQLLRPAGLVWSTGTLDGTDGKRSFSPAGQDLTLLNAATALAALSGSGQSRLTPAQVAQVGATLTHAARALPSDDTTILPKLQAMHTLPGAGEFPRPDKPLTADKTVARLALAHTIELMKKAPVEQLVRAHPAAEYFPGAVPKNAPRLQNRPVAIDTKVPGWHSTGFYAAPGELIPITVPPQLAGKGLRVRIGCHSDALWHHEKWQRVPEITLTTPILQAETRAANPFGGAIYIDVPKQAAAGKVNVSITGAVEAPRFVLGQTKVQEWRSRISKLPAPWAELETKKIIWSVPSDRIRSLNDPETLMKFWDEVLDAQADLATIPRDRERPERIVADTQISAGYMHSGYPIMVPTDGSTDRALTLRALREEGSWGHFHELGHNHQVGDWTFDGTGEVTCNLFSLYCMETLCGQKPGEGHDAMKPEAAEKRMRTYLGMGDKFSRWKSDPFLALTMYHQLRVGFGWETYKKVFAEYRDLAKEQRPKTDDEKRDQWMVRFSRAAGKNLGRFFEAWGVPTSTSARDSIKDLPGWMPADWPKK